MRNAAGRGTPRRGGCQGSVGDAPAFEERSLALWKGSDTQAWRQRLKLDWIAKTDPRLHCGNPLKAGARFVFMVKGQAGRDALERWLGWFGGAGSRRSWRCRKDPRLPQRHQHCDRDHLSNDLIETTTPKIRLITRRAYGFHSASGLIALAMLAIGGPPIHSSRQMISTTHIQRESLAVCAVGFYPRWAQCDRADKPRWRWLVHPRSPSASSATASPDFPKPGQVRRRAMK
jgi:hypothetical protein